MNTKKEPGVLVPAALQPWVSDIRVGAVGDDQQVLTRMPDAATALVFRTTAAQHSDLVVVGPCTHASYHAGKDVPFFVKVRIRPGRARALLGLSVHEIVDHAVPLSDFWGEPGDRLARELADIGSDPLRVLKTIEDALLAHLSAQTSRELSRSDLVHGATKGLSIRANRQPDGVRALARRLSISERHLRNLFTGAVGVSPKRFARIDRVRTVLARAHHEHWAQLATEAGYYDQSHMSAEFREIMGVPPGAFVAGRVPAAGPC